MPRLDPANCRASQEGPASRSNRMPATMPITRIRRKSTAGSMVCMDQIPWFNFACSSLAAPAFAKPVEFRLLLSVKAVVKRDQLRIFFFQRRQSCLDQTLAENQASLEGGQVRLGGAKRGLQIGRAHV